MPKTTTFKRFTRHFNYYPDRRRELHNETVFRNLRYDPRLPKILKAHSEDGMIHRILQELKVPEPLAPLNPTDQQQISLPCSSSTNKACSHSQTLNHRDSRAQKWDHLVVPIGEPEDSDVLQIHLPLAEEEELLRQ